MIEINGNEYALKYNLKRMELIENTTEKPFMAAAYGTKGMLSIRDLKIYFAYGLIDIDGNFVAFGKAQEYAQQTIESEGYLNTNMLVIEAIQRDCPFLFQGA